MVLFYFIWNLVFYFIGIFHSRLESLFLIKNNPFLVLKRSFKFISYFEKLFLVLFYKNGWFEKSIANLYRKKDIIDYRRSKYPLIYSFHLIHNEVLYDISNLNLKFFVKIYKFFDKNPRYFNKLSFFFKLKNKNFLNFIVLNKIFFKKYFNLNSYYFFYEFSQNNLLKFNKLFLLYFLKSKKIFCFFDLNKWEDWYMYNFENNFVVDYSLLKKYTNRYRSKRKNMSLIKKLNLIKFYLMNYEYKIRIRKFNKFFNSKKDNILYFNYNFNNFFKIKINATFSYFMQYYQIKFSESSITKYLNTKNLKNYNFFYLRKNRIFNKGRYSRNRQLYRTGVYWCLWLNIIMVYGLYFVFYRFTFNFGYFWWGIMILAYSTIFSRIIKYNFFNLNYLFIEFYKLINWYGAVINSFYLIFCFLSDKYIKSNNNISKISLKNKNLVNYIFGKYYYYYFLFYKKFVIEKKNRKNSFIWQGMKEKDNSFLRYKTIIHWVKEIFRLIITK